MYQELNSNMIGLLTDLQGSIRELRADSAKSVPHCNRGLLPLDPSRNHGR